MPIFYYLEKAKNILNKNFNGRFTVPSVHLYPHQWNWDSAFISIGYSRYDTDRAILEMSSLFNAQWKNGMLPHIVFNEKNLGKYFPEPDFWQTQISPNVPENFLTSGITQPPIHAYAVLKIYENSRDKNKVKEFLKWIYPKLIKMHRYFYLERNPDDNGLIFIRHPWESGMDNSPMWDQPLEKIDLSSVKIPDFKRKDDKIIDPEQRPGDEDYKRYIYLVELFKKHRYNERKIFQECPFLVIDPLFNSVLCASNEALMKIADIIGENFKQAEEWYLTTARSMRDLMYSKKNKIFYAFDLIERKLIEVETSAGFMPLFGGVASYTQGMELLEYMNSASFCKIHENNCFAIPNYDKTKRDFNEKNYWRGPVWININWMLFRGLKRYSFKQKAEHLEKTILELPMRFGFYEYFDSKYGTGYGTKDFSWTAALFIDLAYDYKENQMLKNGLEITIKNLSEDFILNTENSSISIKDSNKIFIEFNNLTKQIVKNYANNGSVNYSKLRMSPEYKLFQSMAGRLAYFDENYLKNIKYPQSFWINLFNMMVIDFIIKMKVKKSVREIDGFFTKLKYNVGGKGYSLADIEKRLSQLDNSELSILALVRGTQSSPPLKYISPDKGKVDIRQVIKDFINGPEVLIIPEEKTLLVSQLFEWNKNVFKNKKQIIKFVAEFTVDENKKRFLITEKEFDLMYLFYDWYLNN